jgi:hypothetical protein
VQDDGNEIDFAIERDADAAHYELARLDSIDDAERTLFDDEEIADLALDTRHPGLNAHAGSDGRSRAESVSDLDSIGLSTASTPAAATLWKNEPEVAETPTDSQRRAQYDAPLSDDARGFERVDGQPPPDTERPRPAVLPIAITLILGLLVGFAAGYGVGVRSTVLPSRAGQVTQSEPATPGVPATPGQGAGKAYSEQAVARPSAAPPAVPADVPSPRSSASSARATAGRIVVSSTPSRANVTVNGKWRGRTPLTVDALKFGRYAVRVVMPGFAVARENVSLSAAEPSKGLSVRLERAASAAKPPPQAAARPAPAARSAAQAFAGSIYIDSRPRGASVFIDSRPMGTTPVLVPDVSIGSHVVRLELADHRTWSTSTSVSAGQEARVTGSLDRIR